MNSEPFGAASLRSKASTGPEDRDAPPPGSALAMLNELQVRQIELERQIEGLRAAQRELAESRALYVDLIDHSPVGHCTMGSMGRILEANLTLANLLGVERGALVGQSMARFIVKEDEETFHFLTGQILSARPTSGSLAAPAHSCELSLRHATGTSVRVSLVITAALRESGETILRLVLADRGARRPEDVADRLEFQTRMEILNAIPAHIALIDSEGVIQVTNESWRECAAGNPLQGPEFRVGQNYLKACESALGPCSEAAKEVAAGIRRMLRGEDGAGEFAIEYPCHSPTEPRWFRLVATSLREGLQAGAVVMHVDITERKQTETRLLLADLVLKNVSQGVLIAGNDQRLISANPAFTAITGYSEREILGRNCNFLQGTGTDPVTVADIRQALEDGKDYSGEILNYRKDGTPFWNDLTITPVRNRQGVLTHFIGVTRDISERRRSADDLAFTKKLLERTGELANVGGWSVGLDTMKLSWTRETFRIAGIEPPVEPSLAEGINLFAPEARPTIAAAVQAAIDAGTPYDLELPIITASGLHRWVRTQGFAEMRDGRAVRIYGTFYDITERRQSEETLQSRTAFLEAMVDSSVDGILVTDQRGNKLYQNPRTAELWKIPREFAEDPDDRNQLAFVTSRVKDPQVFLERVAFLNAHPRELSHDEIELVDGMVLDRTTSPVLAKDGSVIGRIWTFRDMTARKRSEAALLASEERFRTLVEHSPYCIHEIDLAGRLISMNEAGLKMMGVDEFSAVENMPYLAAVGPRDRERIARLLEAAMAGQPAEFTFEARNGSEFQSTFVPIRDRQGAVRRLMGLSIDITAQKQAEAALLASEARSRAIVQASPVPMALNDAHQNILLINPAFTQNFGYELADIPTLADWWPKAYPDPFYRQWVAETWDRELARSGQTGTDFVPMELSIRCKDGTERIVVVSAAPLEDAFAGTHLIVLQDVTVRRLSENKLRESEARLHTLFEFSPYGILDEDFSAVRAHFDLLRASGVKDFRAHFSAHPDEVTHCALLVKVRDVNNQALRILEAPTKAEILTDISSYFDATAVSVFREELITLAEGRTFFATDMPLRLPSGKNRVCALRLCVVPGSEQSLNQVLVTFEDVTDRRQHEQAQRESAMQLSLVIRGGGIGFWDWNFVSGSLSVNDRWMAILGLDPKGPPPTMDLWHTLVHPDDMPKLVQLIELVILNPDGADGEVEIRARHAAGHYVWILDKFNVVERSADGSPLRVVGTHLDITARKAAELELRESRERFLQLAENIQEVFWISDVAKNHLVYVSPAYETIWGRTCERLYQDPRSWMEAIHPEDRPRIAHAAQTKQALGLYNETYRILRPDGVVRWIHDKAFPVKESTGEIRRIVGTAEDITSRVVLEEQVRQSQKLQTIGTLAAGIAHDFNNILAAIIGNNELAMAEVAPENPARASLDEIRKASARGKGLVQQILAFSSQHPMERRSMALGPVVLEVTKLLRATIPAIVQIDTSVDPDAPPVLADATQIHQILVNLCTNAWHALGDRPGCIEVGLRSITLSAEAAGRIAGLQPGRFACLSVRDNGKGMDPDTLNRIFDPFFTTKGPGKGTGLGLSVVHGIVRGYQGAIQVVSQPGAGTTFTVYFPASVSAPAATAPVTPAASSRRDTSRHILYLDDDESLLFAATRILKRLGYRVTGFDRPADAVKAFRENPSEFDFAVTDMNMPEVTGLAVARDLLKVRADLPIVLVSGNIDEELRDAARAAGICGIVCKPFTIDEISEAIQRLPSNQRQS